MIRQKTKKSELIMKDYVMVGLMLMLIVASVGFLVRDISKNEEVAGYANVSEIEKFYDDSYVEKMEKSQESLTDLQDAGFFKTIFVTTLEIVQLIPTLIGMTVTSLSTVTNLLLGSGSEIIPSEIAMILSVMIFAGLLWAAVYFIRRASK